MYCGNYLRDYSKEMGFEDIARRIDLSKCVDCGACQMACPKKCISPNQ